MTDSKRVIAWRLYYRDGTTADSSQGTFEDAPDENVMGLKKWHADGKGYVHCGEHYIYHAKDDLYYSAGQGGVVVGYAKSSGRQLADHIWPEFYDKMIRDNDIPLGG